MRKPLFAVIISLIVVMMLMSGCIYMKVQRPHDKNYDKTELGTKIGKSSLHSICWLAAWGNAGTRTAAENGDIKVIRHADVEYYTLFLGLYTRLTTVLYGD